VSVISSTQALVAESASPPIGGTFTLRNGEVVSLRAVSLDDVQALTDFLADLPYASYLARFPHVQACKKDLAIDTVYHALQAHPSRRRVSLVLLDGGGRIVGLLDYHERGEPLMQTAVAFAQLQGLTSLRPGLKTGEIDLVLAKALQGQQLGQRLMNFAIEHASQAGYEQIVAVVADKNRAGLSNLAKLGITRGFPLLDVGYKLYVLRPGPDLA
jgi:RimJ/RimL family protein N-acetyltransferase